ncbi:MAG: hydrogenase maturation protease [Nitrospinota bacterium]
MNEPDKNILVIGVGNLYRCDDAVGIHIARNLSTRKTGNFQVIEQSGEGTSLMESWKNNDCVFIIDAVSSGASPGTIHRLDATNPIPSKFFSCSTHNFGVAEAIELGRTLNQLPKHLHLYGIEGKVFEPGEILSPELSSAVTEVTDELFNYMNSTS